MNIHRFLPLLLGAVLSIAAVQPAAAFSSQPPITTTPPLFTHGSGAFIELTAAPLRPHLWTRLQWQDALGRWHDIAGWQGTFDADGRVLWYVGKEHLGETGFRWLVHERQGGELLITSEPFDLPSSGGEILQVNVALPKHGKPAVTTTVSPAPPLLTAAASPWVRAHPVWDSVDGWQWPEEATLHLTINDPSSPANPDLEMEMAGTINPDLGSVWFEFACVYDLKPGDEVTLSDGTTTRNLVVAAVTIDLVDTETGAISGTAAAGQSVSLPSPPPLGRVLSATANNSGRWQANFKQADFSLAPGTMVIAELHEADGDLTSFEWEVPAWAESLATYLPNPAPPEPCTPLQQTNPNTLLYLSFDNSYAGAQGERGTASGPAFTSGKRGLAALFDNTDTLTYATADNLNLRQGSIEFWLRPNWHGGDEAGYVFFEIGDAWFNRLRLMKDEANNLRFLSWDSDTEYDVAMNVAAWRAGDWHHIAASWDGTYITLFVDCVERETEAARLPETLSDAIYVGSSAARDLFANAAIDELRITDVPFSGCTNP